MQDLFFGYLALVFISINYDVLHIITDPLSVISLQMGTAMNEGQVEEEAGVELVHALSKWRKEIPKIKLTSLMKF